MDAPSTSQEPEWMRIEIFGHRVRCGRVTEIERFGTKLCQIEVFEGSGEQPACIEQYGGAAIFSATPCTEEYARDFHRPYSHAPRLHLPAPDDDAVDADVFEDDEIPI